jgi:dipeptidyl aminopeptidase/acylaminoacyl peptidase
MSPCGRDSLRGLLLVLIAFHARCCGAEEVPGSARFAAELPNYLEHQDLSYFLTSGGQRHPIRTPQDWQQRRPHIVLGMEQVMGPLPKPARPVPLNVVTLEEHKEEKFTRRKVAYCTDRTDRRVNAWLLVPNGESTARRPAMLCLHQTTPSGKDSPVGLADRQTLHYARELTERGFVTLSPDYPSLGEHEHDFEADEYASGSMKAIYDNIRAIDLLQTLPEVELERIGCIGHSLGGHNGLFTAVFDERIKAVVTCCGFTRFHKYMKGDLTGWSGPRYMPRIKSQNGLSPDRMPFDFTEVIAAIAPRAVFIVAPVHDDNFEVSGVRDVVAAAQPVFELLGQPARLRAIYPDAGHDFPDAARHEAYEFIEASLKSAH